MSKAFLQCDFCNRDQRNVPIMVAGPYGADICSECVEACVEVIAERRATRGRHSEGPGKP